MGRGNLNTMRYRVAYAQRDDHGKRQSNKGAALCKPNRGASEETLCCHLDLGFTALRNMSKINFSYLSHLI